MLICLRKIFLRLVILLETLEFSGFKMESGGKIIYGEIHRVMKRFSTRICNPKIPQDLAHKLRGYKFEVLNLGNLYL